MNINHIDIDINNKTEIILGSRLNDWSKHHSLTCPERYTSNELDIISSANDKKYIVCKICGEVLDII